MMTAHPESFVWAVEPGSLEALAQLPRIEVANSKLTEKSIPHDFKTALLLTSFPINLI
jgi:hypothetical protein